jgi:hypothetical protein
VGRPQFSGVLRVELLVIAAFVLGLAGVVLARLASTPMWHPVTYPPTHGPGASPKVVTLANVSPGWVVFVLIAGLSALWAGCGWWLFVTSRVQHEADEERRSGHR